MKQRVNKYWRLTRPRPKSVGLGSRSKLRKITMHPLINISTDHSYNNGDCYNEAGSDNKNNDSASEPTSNDPTSIDNDSASELELELDNIAGNIVIEPTSTDNDKDWRLTRPRPKSVGLGSRSKLRKITTLINISSDNKNNDSEPASNDNDSASEPTSTDNDCNIDVDSTQQQHEINGIDESNCVDSSSPLRDQILAQLKAHGLEAYFKSIAGGNLDDKASRTLHIRVAEMLEWTHLFHHQKTLKESDTISWLQAFFISHYQLLIKYIQYLEISKERSPATILHILNDIKKVIVWLSDFKAVDKIQRLDMEPMKQLIRNISIGYHRKVKKDRCDEIKNTLQGIVYSRQLPIEGHSALIKTLLGCKAWVANFVARMNETWTKLDKEEYEIFMQILFSSMFVFAPQGRVGGIASLTCGQGVQMISNGNTYSHEFKTKYKYGYQPVIIAGDFLLLLVETYINVARPKISNCQTAHRPLDPLWLTYTKVKMTNSDISHRISRFFLRTMQLNITTTGIRKMVEIEMESAVRANIISPQERLAIQHINGHSSAVVEDFYLKLDRAADANDGRNAFQKYFDHIGYGSETNSNSMTKTIGWPEKDDLMHAPWGTMHPSYSKTTPKNMRFPWSEEELDYLQNWIQNNKEMLVHSGNRVARCLRYLKNDPVALPIFHVHHIMNSSRLRTGFDRAMTHIDNDIDDDTGADGTAHLNAKYKESRGR